MAERTERGEDEQRERDHEMFGEPTRDRARPPSATGTREKGEPPADDRASADAADHTRRPRS